MTDLVHHPATVLVGRRAEQAAVSAFLDAVPGHGGALVLAGEAGIGKTAIWLQAVDAACERGYRVLRCRPTEVEATLPYVSLGDLIEPVLDRPTITLTPRQRSVLETALARIEPDGALGRLTVSRATLALLRAAAVERPTILAIDDIQWLDAPSAHVLGFVTRRLGDLPIGVLATSRTHDDPSPLALDGAFASPPTKVPVAPLGSGDIDAILRARLGLRLPRPRLLELTRVSGGNPLFALEIARAACDAGSLPGDGPLAVPRSLGALLRQRLAGLSADSDDMVLLAAAATQPTPALIEHVTGDLAGLVGLISRGILEVDGRRLRFTHPLLASIAYGDALPGQRRAAHRRLADAVSDAEERAHHLALGIEGPSAEVAHDLEEAARLAAGRGAPESAADLSEHAARLTPTDLADDRRRRLALAAEHHVAAGDPTRARTILEGLVASLGPGPVRADLLWRLADAVGDDLGLSIRLCEQALAEVGDSAPIEAQVHTALGVFTWLAGDLERSARHCRASAECAARAGDDRLLAVSLGELCHAETVLGRRYHDQDMTRALEIEGGMASFPANLRPSYQLGIIRMYTDDLEGARPLLVAELERARNTGDEAARFGVLFRLAELSLRGGDWGAAARDADEALASAQQSGIEQEQSVILMVHALVRAHLGDLEDAEGGAERALAIAERSGDRIVAIRSRGVLGFVELSRGDAASAIEHLRPAGTELRALGVGELSISGVVQNEVEALIALGRSDEAEDVLCFMEEKGRPTGRAWHAAIAARGRALIASARGESDQARCIIERALVHHTRLPQPFELGRTLLAQGQIERRARQRSPARDALIRALDLFDGLGAPRWAEKAAEELARIPGRGRQEPATDLTETERRVAELVAEGLSNKEVAARLFISVRTVEANLSRAFAKLGLRSRTELAIRLGPSPRPSSQQKDVDSPD